MSQPPSQPQPPSSPASGPGPRPGMSLVLLMAALAGIVFWAGLTLGSQGAGRSPDERAAVEAFSQTYRVITQQYIGSPAPEELLEGAIRGMFEVLEDPYSSYLRADEFDAALDDARGEFEGIGAVMSTQDETGDTCGVIGAGCRLRVLQVLPDAPAQRAGLLVGDTVLAVDGTELPGSTIADAVERIRGPRGSDVTLTLERDGGARELTITRDVVVSEDVRSAVLADGQVGYLAIDSFSLGSAADVEAALQEHLDAGREHLVLDVRDDPGGFVDATVAISSQFLQDGAVFWEEDADGRQTAVDVSGGGRAVDTDVSLVVLVNGGTASASEILAGAIQDAGRGRLVGERTFGKGTVQEWTELPGDKGGFRLSVAKWLTRDKRWIDGRGLLPDVAVADDGERYRPDAPDADPALDAQLQAAIDLLLRSPAPEASPSPGSGPSGE